MDNHLYIYRKGNHEIHAQTLPLEMFSWKILEWSLRYMVLSTLFYHLLNACVLMSHLFGLQPILIAAFIVFYVPMLIGRIMAWHIKWATNYS